jgi:hypothetical protein
MIEILVPQSVLLTSRPGYASVHLCSSDDRPVGWVCRKRTAHLRLWSCFARPSPSPQGCDLAAERSRTSSTHHGLPVLVCARCACCNVADVGHFLDDGYCPAHRFSARSTFRLTRTCSSPVSNPFLIGHWPPRWSAAQREVRVITRTEALCTLPILCRIATMRMRKIELFRYFTEVTTDRHTDAFDNR